MENKNKIQYALAFSAILILGFQFISYIQLQTVYALSYDTIMTVGGSNSGSNSAVLTAVRSGDTIFYLGRITSSRYNVTAIDADTHTVLMSVSTCGISTVCNMDGFSQLLACEGCVDDSVFLYSNGGLRKFDASGLVSIAIPCSGFGTFNNLHSKTYSSIHEISSFCSTQKIWVIDSITMAVLEITPTITNIGGSNTCPFIYDGLIDVPNKRVIALCYHHTENFISLNLYSYTDSSLSDLTFVRQLNLPNGYIYLATSGLSYSFVTVSASNGADNPPLQISVSDSDIHVFHTFPVGGGNSHMPLFIPNPSSPSAIGVLWIYNTQEGLVNGFLPHNSTSIGGILCGISDCYPQSGLPLSYYPTDRNFFYSGGWSTRKIIIWNSTEETGSIYAIDVSSGNGTGGNGGNSTGGTTGNTCDFSDPSCTIPVQVGHGLCIFHLFDCDSNSDIKTNGVGFLLLIVMLGLLIVFFAILRKKANLQIHPIIWVGGMLAVFGLAVGAQLVEGYWFILAIVVIVAFGGFNVWNSRRQQ